MGGKARLAMLVTLVALSVGVSVGLANGGPSQIKSNLYLGSVSTCPPTVYSKNSAGTVTINNVKGEWAIVVHMRGAKPGDYHVDLRDSPANNCNQFATSLGQFKVGPGGTGDDQTPYSASGVQSFYLRVHDPDQSITYITPLLKIGG